MKNSVIFNYGIKKIKSNNNMESDHIVIEDINKNILELFWFSHEVIIFSEKCSNFTFLKKNNTKLYNLILNFAKNINRANKNVNGNFINENAFIWHHISRAWDRPFEKEAGFIATLDSISLKIDFFPAKTSLIKSGNYFISMGGPDGYIQPYQSISNVFAITLNQLLNTIPYKNSEEQEKI